MTPTPEALAKADDLCRKHHIQPSGMIAESIALALDAERRAVLEKPYRNEPLIINQVEDAMTRAKVSCIGVRKYVGWGSTPPPMFYEAEFVPVIGTSEENMKFCASTPAGSIKLSTIREDHFMPGKSYYLDVTEVE